MPVSVAAARDFSLALMADGTVRSWGWNDADGGLGDGSDQPRREPVYVEGLWDVRLLEAGRYHTLAVSSNGTVWAWGYNGSGQLGEGTTAPTLLPVAVLGLSDATAVSAGGFHSLALMQGSVWAWGDNSAGQLGNGTTNGQPLPERVRGLQDVTSIAAGSAHSLALSNGTVWAWGGSSEDGELGNGSTQSSPLPVRVSGLSGVSAISAGSYHGLALSNGWVWAWGYNRYGQLGAGTTNRYLEPVPVLHLSNVVSISAGGYHGLALRADGTVWAWGLNEDGQLGDGTARSRSWPQRVPGLDHVIAIAAGNYHSLALRADGTVWSWGRNEAGQLGDDTTQPRLQPVPIDALAVCPPWMAHPLARTGPFRRGDSPWPDGCSLVVPLDFQKGVKLTRLGGAGDWLYDPQPWPELLFHLNGADPSIPLPFQNPVAAFGRRAGGSPLYLGQSYRFAIYAGEPGDTSAEVLAIKVYRRPELLPVATHYIRIPSFSEPEQWTAFLAQGSAILASNHGLATTVTFSAPTDFSWVPGRAGVFQLQHRADPEALGYLFVIEGRGEVDGQPLVRDGEAGGWSRLYSLEFEPRPPWQPVLLGRPHFEGEPAPPNYPGTSAAELRSSSWAVTNRVELAPESYTNLDHSPELRRHPILDQFVADLAADPLALARFVLNEIELTDALAYPEDESLPAGALCAGGLSRGALGVFLEGQGSPWEQCALLVYLLRQAGVPAAYMIPSPGGLFLPRRSLSTLLRMQLQSPAATLSAAADPDLVPVNYPWVVAFVDGHWSHLFPWLKDTEIVEGLELGQYLPPECPNGTAWVHQYLVGDTNILGLSAESDLPSSLFPLFLERSLRTRHPGIALDDLGVRIRNRRHDYLRWNDFPTPASVTPGCRAVESLGAVSAGGSDLTLTQLFDTVEVEVWSLAHPEKKIATGPLRLADLHNRKFLVRHEPVPLSNPVQHQMLLVLAPFRPDAGGVGAYTNDAVLLRRQEAAQQLGAEDDLLRLRLSFRRQRWLAPGFQTQPPPHRDLWPGYSGVLEWTLERPLRKGDLAAICLNVGRVTQPMLDVHAEEFWAMERALQQDPAMAVPAEVQQGTAAYLMGMSYYQAVDRFAQQLERLHKIQRVSWWAAGLARLSPQRIQNHLPEGELSPVLPSLDMFFSRMAVAGNGTLHPDSGLDPILAGRDFARLLAAEGSAQEHAVINHFFGQAGALSTVRLLHLAQRDAQNGSPGILILNRDNYQRYGETQYHGRALRLHDPALWTDVTNAFAVGSGAPWGQADFVQVYITPGTNAYNQDAYRGMGAMILTEQGDSALISGDLHGGVGERLSQDFFQPGLAWALSLQLDLARRYVLRYDIPGQDQDWLAPDVTTPFDLPGVIENDQSGVYLRSDLQEQFGVLTGRLIRGEPVSYGEALQITQERGNLGPPSNRRGALAWLADPVHAVTGEFCIDATDLVLPGPMPLQLRRNYSSHSLAATQFGYGWKPNFVPCLVVSEDQGTIYAAESDGTVVAYALVTPGHWRPVPEQNPSLNNHSRDGIGGGVNLFNAEIVRHQREDRTEYELFGADGSRRLFGELTFPGPVLSVRPCLLRWEDPRATTSASTMAPMPSTRIMVRSAASRAATAAFCFFATISTATSPKTQAGDGRRMLYEYDTFSDLVRILAPDGAETHYQYEHGSLTVTNQTGVRTLPYSTHLLVREVKPEGRLLVNKYDPARRVVAQLATVGPDLEPVTNAVFVYENDFAWDTVLTRPVSGHTVVRDVHGHLTRYDYAQGLITQITDPLGHALVQDWFEPHEADRPGYAARSLERVVDPRGLELRFAYDAAGNLTNRVCRGDLTGRGDTNEVAAECYLFNAQHLLVEKIDPVSRRTCYLYSSAEPYLLSATIDYAGEVLLRQRVRIRQRDQRS